MGLAIWHLFPEFRALWSGGPAIRRHASVLHWFYCCCRCRLSSALDRPSNQSFSVCLCVCEQIGFLFCVTIFTKFCMQLRNVVASRLLFVRQTGSSLPILQVCGYRFRQFSAFGDHIFQQISTKSHIQIKFSNADFVLSGEWFRR